MLAVRELFHRKCGSVADSVTYLVLDGKLVPDIGTGVISEEDSLGGEDERLNVGMSTQYQCYRFYKRRLQNSASQPY